MFGEDEEGCEDLPFSCKKDLFRCPNEMRYINISWVCDGLGDCSNSADEQPALCPTSTVSPSAKNAPTVMEPEFYICAADEYTCDSGECVQLTMVCDGIRQCADGTDEGSYCCKSLHT